MTYEIVNLTDDLDFSDDDITNRSEFWVYGHFPPKRREILDRNIEAARMGLQIMPDDKKAELQQLQTILFQAGLMADRAREVMALKRRCWSLEATMRELAALPNDEEHDEERAELQHALDSADPQVLMAVSLRGRIPSGEAAAAEDPTPEVQVA